MSLFPRPLKRRLRRRSRGSRTLWFTAMRVSGMLFRGITEHTTTPLRLILPTAGQANSWHSNLDDRRDFRRWVSVAEANAESCHTPGDETTLSLLSESRGQRLSYQTP